MPIRFKKANRINSAWEALELYINQKESMIEKNSLSKFLNYPYKIT
jgi:hypothetical protein